MPSGARDQAWIAHQFARPDLWFQKVSGYSFPAEPVFAVQKLQSLLAVTLERRKQKHVVVAADCAWTENAAAPTNTIAAAINSRRNNSEVFIALSIGPK